MCIHLLVCEDPGIRRHLAGQSVATTPVISSISGCVWPSFVGSAESGQPVTSATGQAPLDRAFHPAQFVCDPYPGGPRGRRLINISAAVVGMSIFVRAYRTAHSAYGPRPRGCRSGTRTRSRVISPSTVRVWSRHCSLPCHSDQWGMALIPVGISYQCRVSQSVVPVHRRLVCHMCQPTQC